MKKVMILLAVLTAAACIFSACGTQNGSEKNAKEPSSELSTTLNRDTHESISYAITEDEARGIADEALKDAMAQNEFGIGEDYEIFAFESMELLSKGEQYCAFNAGATAQQAKRKTQLVMLIMPCAIQTLHRLQALLISA